MNSQTSTPRRHVRLVLLVAAVLAAVAIAAWVLDGARGGRPAASDAAAAAETAQTDLQQAAPPTAMPDGSPIPSPSPGSPDALGEGRTEAVEPVATTVPVALDETGDFGTGLTVELTGISPVEGVARAPGEIAGPALEVSVEALNDSSQDVSLDGVVVFLSYGADRVPASEFGHGSAPLSGSVAPGAATPGTYVFAVPEGERDDIRVEVSYTGEAPTVVFTGSVD